MFHLQVFKINEILGLLEISAIYDCNYFTIVRRILLVRINNVQNGKTAILARQSDRLPAVCACHCGHFRRSAVFSYCFAVYGPAIKSKYTVFKYVHNETLVALG